MRGVVKCSIGRLVGFDAHFVSGNGLCCDYFLPILNWVLGPQTSEERGSSTFSRENFTF